MYYKLLDRKEHTYNPNNNCKCTSWQLLHTECVCQRYNDNNYNSSNIKILRISTKVTSINERLLDLKFRYISCKNVWQFTGSETEIYQKLEKLNTLKRLFTHEIIIDTVPF